MFTQQLQSKESEAIEISKLIPSDFLSQKNAHGFFEVTGDMVIDRLLSIKMIEGIRTSSNSCATKFKFEGLTSVSRNKMSLQAMQKGAQTPGQWLAGFKSLAFELNDSIVEKGLLTDRELEALCTHSDWYQSVGNSDYYKSYSKTRLYLSPKVESARFIFDIEPRLNPTNNELTVGIIPKIWSPHEWELIGNVTPGESIGSVGQTIDSSALSLLDS
jgi:hypothetical protein